MNSLVRPIAKAYVCATMAGGGIMGGVYGLLVGMPGDIYSIPVCAVATCVGVVVGPIIPPVALLCRLTGYKCYGLISIKWGSVE